MKLREITTPKLTSVMKDIQAETSVCTQNICDDTKHLPQNRQEKKKMSIDENEIKRFIGILDTKPWDEDFKRIIKVLFYTGMCSGECLGLMCEDIDFDER